MATDLPAFVLVMAVTPRGFWRHRGLHFTRDWSVVQVGDRLDVLASPIPMVDETNYNEILASKAELAVKPASAEELDAFQATIAANRGLDKDFVIHDLQTKNADLEARFMRLELGRKDDKDRTIDSLRHELEDAQHRSQAAETRSLDLEDRMKRLEEMLKKAVIAPSQPPTPSSPPASDTIVLDTKTAVEAKPAKK